MLECAACKRPPAQAGPIVDGYCQYCAADRQCYVCGRVATNEGQAGKLCDDESCKKTDAFRDYTEHEQRGGL